MKRAEELKNVDNENNCGTKMVTMERANRLVAEMFGEMKNIDNGKCWGTER